MTDAMAPGASIQVAASAADLAEGETTKLPREGSVRHRASKESVPLRVLAARRETRPSPGLPDLLTPDGLAHALAWPEDALFPGEREVWTLDVEVDGVAAAMHLPGDLTQAQAVETAWARGALIGAVARAEG